MCVTTNCFVTCKIMWHQVRIFFFSPPVLKVFNVIIKVNKWKQHLGHEKPQALYKLNRDCALMDNIRGTPWCDKVGKSLCENTSFFTIFTPKKAPQLLRVNAPDFTSLTWVSSHWAVQNLQRYCPDKLSTNPAIPCAARYSTTLWSVPLTNVPRCETKTPYCFRVTRSWSNSLKILW